ncbi:MAG: hypothetical protein M3O33_23405, partial [Cyanobacteriota bacterium]|nr:hypothetical protein [Cyanobacteriota bacterium]
MTATTPKNRRNRKTQDAAEVTELKDIFNEEPEKTVSDAAEYVGTTEAQLLEMFCERLSDGSVLAWHTIPIEHELLLDEFKNLVAAENSVRRFDIPTEPAAELPPVVEQILELPEEPQPKQSKRKSSALTERKTKTIQKATQDAEKLDTGIAKAEQLLRAQKGAKAGAKLATIELLAEESAYNQVKSAALKRKVAALVNELAEEENFDPDELLKEVGLDSIPDTLQDLMEEIAPA